MQKPVFPKEYSSLNYRLKIDDALTFQEAVSEHSFLKSVLTINWAEVRLLKERGVLNGIHHKIILDKVSKLYDQTYFRLYKEWINLF
ncbi:hypothetical protein DQ356_02630 [Chryseobacterium lacus]|uniref:Uncharacterized protein n=1 Tax=Chryseobacterium lacus TaxID=2058346 RepID=A0A368N3T8_9FLAO|nr:hypothetical protein DQ356_02630 [Chryseobacterium lacus]